MLHANKETNLVKNKLTKILLRTDVNCVSVVLDKVVIHSEDLYIFALEKIIQHFSILDKQSFIVARKDTLKSYNQKITRIFNNYGMLSIFSTPTSEKSLQIADFYCWAIFSKFEHDKFDYFNKLKHQITIL